MGHTGIGPQRREGRAPGCRARGRPLVLACWGGCSSLSLPRARASLLACLLLCASAAGDWGLDDEGVLMLVLYVCGGTWVLLAADGVCVALWRGERARCALAPPTPAPTRAPPASRTADRMPLFLLFSHAPTPHTHTHPHALNCTRYLPTFWRLTNCSLARARILLFPDDGAARLSPPPPTRGTTPTSLARHGALLLLLLLLPARR